MSRDYLTNQLGDVYAWVTDGKTESINPDLWGWIGKGGKNAPSKRRSLEDVRVMTGFDIEVSNAQSFGPGPKPKGTNKWMNWTDGAAPPTVIRSRAGNNGTIAYFNRLSDALGQASARLSLRPERSPFHVWDFVEGRKIVIQYDPPPPKPGSAGTVYLLDDGVGIKVGFTSGSVSKRIRSLQTGNSRRIDQIAEIQDAGVEIETLIHGRLVEWNTIGEWFARKPILSAIEIAGGVEQWLLDMLPKDSWDIEVCKSITK